MKKVIVREAVDDGSTNSGKAMVIHFVIKSVTCYIGAVTSISKSDIIVG